MIRAAFIIAVAFLCATATATSPIITVTPRQAAKLTTRQPQLEYPVEARARRVTGDGFFRLRVQKATGRVKQVTVLQTTGSGLLDAAAIEGLSQWRFKAGVLRSIEESNPHSTDPLAREDCLVRVPISFVLYRDGAVTKGHNKGLSLHEAMSRAAEGR